MTEKKLHYKRMFETKEMRPYYSIPHVEIGAIQFKKFSGFGYLKEIDIVSSEMNNETYHDIDEMKQSTEYFSNFWEDESKTQSLIKNIEETFKQATEVEDYGKKQSFKDKDLEELISDMNLFYDFMCKTMVRTVISQPQHILPLDKKINYLLEKYPNKDQILLSATYVDRDLPWVEENKIIENLNKKWEDFSEEEKLGKLNWLVKEYGWFNEIEGNKSFDTEHYRKKIEEFHPENKNTVIIEVPDEIKRVGNLIGEFGFLRFWGRYHFMVCRYYLKKVLEELYKKYQNLDLEFATVEEIREFLNGNNINWEEIKERKNGYGVCSTQEGKARIVVGKELEDLKELVREDILSTREIKGVTANKGRATGKVRVVSFTAKDYNDQVEAFQKGEILVTGMTRPQIVHLCKKAIAIVTDEGGITSHAAVISREFNLPCVIATHNATRILKTGDLVEVDANNGIVKIIK
jgi:phosphoenolpyruvate synthase/pyruvate phosphate dikinase